ncbi:cell division protein FtsL [Mariprofundus ferrinatatus]|uniref:cell division protein FtsL n=1 Tax=Mariprofundus ferrinatatus TaxID=1921087 RepID=UPI000C225331|nr:cell division protein FtsL [Mariprofundus ferrinatatus]
MTGSLLRPWLLVPVLAGSLAAGQIWLSHLRYELSLETQKLNTEKQDVLSESGKLRLELASLTRPERLRKLAQEKLGMKPPGPAQVVHP